jgi:hypothetical protein
MGSILSMQWPVAEEQHRREISEVLLVVEGAIHQLRGRFSVLRGTLFHNDVLRATGYRQQLVGMLQRFWRRDRKSVEAWVDSLLRKPGPMPAPRAAWRPRSMQVALVHKEN